MSHRWGYPDAEDVVRCACGAVMGNFTIGYCELHAPTLYFSAYANKNAKEWLRLLGVDAQHVPPPRRAELRDQHWMVDENGEVVRGDHERMLDRHVRPAEWAAARVRAAAREVERRQREYAEDQERCAREGVLRTKPHDVSYPHHGGICRLGLELREADGIAAKEAAVDDVLDAELRDMDEADEWARYWAEME